MKAFSAISQPNPIIGVGLRHLHYAEALSNLGINQEIDFVELHAENFFAAGGISRELLVDVADTYLVSIHGTSLGLGSNVALPSEVLEQFAEVVHVSNATLVSEHLCFNRADINGKIYHSGDLLPMAYNEASLEILSNNIDRVQTRLARPILIENLSAYIAPSNVDFMQLDSMNEMEFLLALCNKSGCGLLLDLNNLIVNCLNSDNQKTTKTNSKQANDKINQIIINNIAQLPKHLIGEIHLAGFSPSQVNGFVVDDHASAVSEQCWELYKKSTHLFGNKPTLIEWDNNLPEWSALLDEAFKAKALGLKLQNAQKPQEKP